MERKTLPTAVTKVELFLLAVIKLKSVCALVIMFEDTNFSVN